MILNEGGNVFANAEPFDQKFVPAILKTVNGALNGTGITAIPVGSAATPKEGKVSGDMDVIVDETAVLEFFKSKDAKSARKELSNYIQKQGLETAQSGINVHVNVPVGNSHHQVDIMVTQKADRVSKFHTHDIPQGSPYKGVNKQLMLAILAKSKGYMWSAWQGLFSRNPEGKKGDFISDDLDEIARILFGKAANASALGSVESILKSLPQDQAEALLARAKEDPNWKEVKQENIQRIRQLAGLNEEAPPPMPNTQGLTPGQAKDLGNGEKVTLKADGTISYMGGFGEYIYDKTGKAIKYNSPNFAGVGKSTDLTTNKTTTSYSAGPMNIKQGPDGEMDAEYDFGVAKAKMSKTAQGATSGSLTPTESAELESMLRIAGLR